jgi:hypothetical protein
MRPFYFPNHLFTKSTDISLSYEIKIKKLLPRIEKAVIAWIMKVL